MGLKKIAFFVSEWPMEIYPMLQMEQLATSKVILPERRRNKQANENRATTKNPISFK